MKTRLVGGLLAAVSVVALSAGCLGSSRAQVAGSPAASAELAALGTWDSTKTYAKDDIATARGSSWISLQSGNKNKVPGQTGAQTTAAWWQLFARGFNPTGAWSSATKYQPDDLVTYLGQTWRSKVTNLNKQPTANAVWELLAAKGAAGPNTGIGAGTATAPSISFSGDANTGIFSPASGQIALVEDGAKVFHTGQDPQLSNIAVGKGALANVQGLGQSNTAVGAAAGAQLTTAANNVAVGTDALRTLTNKDNNVAVGSGALRVSTAGESNTAIGTGAMASSDSGSNNVAVGTAALTFNSSGSANVAVGYAALNQTGVGDRNVAIGRGALQNNSSGSDNIAIGDQAGTSAASGATNNILIGNSGSGFNNAIVIGGAQTTAQIAGIFGQTSTGGAAVFVNSSGRLGTATSSRRFKQDIESMAGAGDILAKLRPVSFRYKQADADGSKPQQYGLIAEEVEQVNKDLVVYNETGGIHTVKYHVLPSFLLAGYQEQQKTIAAQADEIAALKERLARIEALVARTTRASLQ